MESEARCQPATLACHGNGRISRCDHGVVHVSLGAVSLRLSEEQFRGVARLFAEAAVALPALDDDPRPALLC